MENKTLPYIRENVISGRFEPKLAYDGSGAPNYAFVADEPVVLLSPRDESVKTNVASGDIIIMDFHNVEKVTTTNQLGYNMDYTEATRTTEVSKAA